MNKLIQSSSPVQSSNPAHNLVERLDTCNHSNTQTLSTINKDICTSQVSDVNEIISIVQQASYWLPSCAMSQILAQ